jgi:molybdopterin/thiamine biosynthesis adenylyltransferase
MTNLKKMLAESIIHTRGFYDRYTPLFFDLLYSEDCESINSILKLPGLKVFDTIHGQLKELIKTKNPTETFTQRMLEDEIEKHLAGIPELEYGTWVYYSWSNKLVHILPENEFVKLRTNRNKYKITDIEQEILSAKKIGVIGLSVGQSVSLTLAMERTFGELRIADFDELEITNLNRLRSGIHNMGIRKTILVAREISEIDPYLKVTCFHEGVNDNNLEQFLLENGKLDMLIDECDSVDVKINCRIAARRHGIPVIMEASDRGTVDIERYDLNSEYPILHGNIDHLDLSKAGNLTTNEEKLPFILPIIGIDTMSPRLKASSIEVGQTISGWPQLASAVMMGGGITADVCRRILLNQLHVSGRFFIDIEELITDPVANKETEVDIEPAEPLTAERMQAYADQVLVSDVLSYILDTSIVKILINAARIAPSAGNNQPWKWFYDNGRLFLFHSRERTNASGDIHNIGTYLSLGAAIENLSLRATQMGLICIVEPFPMVGGVGDELVAVIRFRIAEKEEKDELVHFLEARCTNRNSGNKMQISEMQISEINDAVEQFANIGFRLEDSREKIDQLAAIIGKTEKLRIFIEQGHKEFFETEIRWTAESAEKTKDGIDLRTVDLSLKDITGLRLMKDLRAAKLLSEWGAGKAIEKLSADGVSSASGIGVLTVPVLSKEFSFNAGRAMERVWLAATKAGLTVQPFFAPIHHFALIRNHMEHTLPSAISAQFKVLYDEFASVVALKSEEPIFIFRFCYAEDVKVRTFRLDTEDIFFIGNNS